MEKIVGGLVVLFLLAVPLSSRALDPEMRPLALDSVGLTLKGPPKLYYFISHPTSLQIRFTLRDTRKILPTVDIPLPSPGAAGIQEIRLKEYNVVLEPGVEYHWFVSAIREPDSPTRDIVVGGVIERVDSREVNYDGRPCDMDAVRYFAKAGIWYDTLTCVNELIEANPQDKKLRDLRRERVLPPHG